MKLISAIILSGLIIFPVLGQPKTEVAWYRYYDGVVSGIDIPNDAALDNESNLYIAGRSTGEEGMGQDLLILKYGRDGELINNIRFVKPNSWEEAHSIYVDEQQNIFVSGEISAHGGSSQGIYQKFDKTGHLIWSHTMAGIPSQNNGIHLVDSELNLIIGFTEADTSAGFAKFDSETGKDTIWTKSYSIDGDYFELADMVVDQEDNLYAILREYYYCGVDLSCIKAKILKFDSTGELLWEIEQDDRQPDAFITDHNGNLYVDVFIEYSQPALQKIESNGELVWENSFSYRTHDITDFAIDGNGNIVICYWGRSGSSFFYTLEKHSAGGDTLWTNRYEYEETNFTIGSGLHIDSENNIYVTGHNQGLQVFKFSEDGNLLWTEKKELPEGVSYDGNWVFTNDYDEVFVAGRMADSETGWNFLAMKVNENIKVSNEPISEQIPRKIKLLQNYPNPFNPRTIIEYEVNIQGNIRVLVYDQTGRIVRELINSHHLAGTYTVEFDAQNLASGIYYYHLQTSGEEDIGKAVLIK
ncbi:MAG: T9SS type A sorting domain-containing protein [Gracilimonas sp.]